MPVNWCPALGTVLANEEVVGGVSERGGHPVVRLPMKQWMLKITAYADRLLEGLDGLEWDENIKVGLSFEFFFAGGGARLRERRREEENKLQKHRFAALTWRASACWSESDPPAHSRAILFSVSFTLLSRPLCVRFEQKKREKRKKCDGRKTRLEKLTLCLASLSGFPLLYLSLSSSQQQQDMQRNWIGRSEGCDVVFGLVGGEGSQFAAEEAAKAAGGGGGSGDASSSSSSLTAFTTRADTLFGVTYVVLAPEHPLALKLATTNQKAAVEAYIKSAASKSDLERTAEKTGAASRSGVDTGSFALHPITNARVPVWVADYVLGSYGTGAVMAVPAHDTRDAEFAQAHGLPTVEVVVEAEKEEKKSDGAASSSSSSSSLSSSKTPFTSDGVCVSSRGNGLDLDGLRSEEARDKVGAFLAERQRGGPRVSYKLRDWLFARQRYWGEPFPIAYAADGDAFQDSPLPIDESQLPLVLPPTDDFSPNGTPDPPLAALKDWVSFRDPATGRKLVRETSTMPQWAGSCWYYIRYLQPWNDEKLVDRAAADYWLPVDLYVGAFLKFLKFFFFFFASFLFLFFSGGGARCDYGGGGSGGEKKKGAHSPRRWNLRLRAAPSETLSK